MRVPATGACHTAPTKTPEHTSATAADAIQRLGAEGRRHAVTSAPRPSTTPTAGETAIDAAGRLAKARAAAQASPASNREVLRQHQPAGVPQPPSASPARHVASMASIAGSTTRFATGATMDTLPNAAAHTGNVDAWAATVAANPRVHDRGAPGAAWISHSDSHGPITRIPATAHTDSWKPTSKPAIGFTARIAVAAAANAARGSGRSATSCAHPAMESMAQARTAESGHPVTAANAQPETTEHTTSVLRLRAHVPAIDITAPDTMPTCSPETASACDRPDDLKSASTSLPARRLLSPRATPARRAPASPLTRSRTRPAQPRQR